MVFLVTGFEGAVADTVMLTSALENVAISAGGGSIAMHVSDDLSIPADHMASHSGAVTIVKRPQASQNAGESNSDRCREVAGL